MNPFAALGLVLGAILLGFAHLAMYAPRGIGTPALIGLAGLALVLVVFLGLGSIRHFLRRKKLTGD